MVDVIKIKKLKEKSKGRKPRPNFMIVIVIIVIISIVALLAITLPPIIKSMQEEKILTLQSLENAKKTAIASINSLFSKYPSDPMKSYFIGKINAAKSQEEINKILEEAQQYIKLKEFKENLKNQIKNIYGNYLSESPLAQKVMLEIDEAKSVDEAENIYLSNLEKLKEDARHYYISKYKNEVANSNYVRVIIDGKEYLYSTADFLKELNSYDLETLKKLKVYKVNMCEATLPVLAEYCGNIPKPGDKIMIYKLGTNKSTPITEAIIKDVYIIFPKNSIQYSESKSSKISLTEDKDTTSASKDININYKLNGITDVLHAAVMGKIDYNTLKYKLSEYGYKLNKLEEDTQIFDPNIIYLFIIKVPSDKASEIIGLKYQNTAIVKINK
ncbi:DUF515 domain-containing protein [Methanocaldococcus sp.]|uniref:DUF515 domain-containing protein n=1 Tax=Methanocaldococcus sp. TaxID=2152917 RepID=UPI00263050B1|nr:DUF515 domain-containing protein [Methanocaldococcus sp.]MCQ6253498.1 DUF515 domain-containing protein [Methanocaldococcus sp.]